MESQHIVVLVKSPVGKIHIMRADKLNSVNREMAEALRGAVAKLDADPAVKVIVITGIEKAFAAGWDVPSYAERPEISLPTTKPLVAAVSGYCVGSGLEIALNCDIVLASDNAVFAAPEITIGEFDRRIAEPLIKAAGRLAATDMLMTGRVMTASEALSRGLASRVVQGPALVREAESVANRLAAMDEDALKAIKSLDNKQS